MDTWYSEFRDPIRDKTRLVESKHHDLISHGKLIDIDHEENDLSDWSSNNTGSGGTITATAGSAMGGSSFGMNVAIDGTDNQPIYNTATLPYVLGNPGQYIRFRFYLDPNGVDIGDSSTANWNIINLVAGAAIRGRVRLRKKVSGSGFELAAAYVNDSSSAQETAYVELNDAINLVEVEVRYALTGVSADAHVKLWINQTTPGVPDAETSTFDAFDIGGPDAFRVGVASSANVGQSGSFFIDDFCVNDTGIPIGGVLPEAVPDVDTWYRYASQPIFQKLPNQDLSWYREAPFQPPSAVIPDMDTWYSEYRPILRPAVRRPVQYALGGFLPISAYDPTGRDLDCGDTTTGSDIDCGAATAGTDLGCS
jgi:hypothetical protein